MESIFKLGLLLSVIDRVSGPSTKIGHSMIGLRGKAMSLGPVFDKFKSYGLIMTTVGAALINIMAGAAMATVPTQKALGELSSVGIENLQALENAGTEFSGKWAGTTTAEFIAAAYDIKSGIASLSDEGVAEFTKLAALTGKATKSTTSEMTSLFATGYGIYKGMYENLSDMQFGEVFSAGISASVKNFKTTGSGMAQAISSLGATATTAKVPLAEQLSILGMLQATMSGSEAGTKYKAMMQSAAGAGEKLNLQFLDANNQLLGMPVILQTLQKKYGSTLDAMEKMEIQKAFGTQEAVAVIDLLYGKVGDLKTNITGLSGAMDQGTSFTEQMAATMNKDIGAGIQLLAQRFHNLVVVIGKKLNPILIPLFSWIGNIINRMIVFAGHHETLVQAAVFLVGGVASVVFVLGILAAVMGAVGLLFPNITVGFSLIGKAALMMKTGLLSAVASTKTWILWQRQAFLTTLYVEGGLLAYAKTLATAPFRALKKVAVATWGHITSLYAQFTAAVASAGGIKALAISMGTGLITSIVGATTSVWSFTTALLANPITWIVLAVVGLVAGLIILEKEFGILSKTLDMFMYGLGYVAGVAVRTGKILLDAFMMPFRSLGAFIDRVGGVGNAMKMLFKLVLSIVFPPLAIAFHWDAVKTGVKTMISCIKGIIPEFLAVGKALWGAFSDGIKSMAMNPVETAKSSLAKLRNLLPFSDAKEGPLSTLTLSGARMMDTIGTGIQSAGPGLIKTVSGVMAGVAAITSVGGDFKAQPVPLQPPAQVMLQNTKPVIPPAITNITKPATTKKFITNPEKSLSFDPEKLKQKSADKSTFHPSRQPNKTENHFHINGLTLPNVNDLSAFVAELQNLAEGHDV
jgi:TP901 family phage tail tape measure protein